MIQLRIREFGSSEWTYVTLAGDLGEALSSLLAGRAEAAGLHVQSLDEDGEWGDVVE